MRRLGLLVLFAACTPESRLDPVTAVQPSQSATLAATARYWREVRLVAATARPEIVLLDPVTALVGPAPAMSLTPAVIIPSDSSTKPGITDPAGAVVPAMASAPQPSASVAAGATALPVTVMRPELPPPGLVTAAHDDAITALAATADGRVVVTLDRRGGLRLWPSLDGAHAPVIVHSEAAAQQVAIARDGSELVIAAAGPLGQLELIRLGALGEPLGHRWVDLERKLVALHATASRFVALRDDQVIAAIDLRGERIEQLAAGAGERIVELTSRDGSLLAFVRAEAGLHARWIDAGGTLAWGGESAALRIDPSHAVLAPDHKRVAALSRDRNAIVIVELASGRTLERPVVMDFVDPARRPLGFIDDRTLKVQSGLGSWGWWHRGELTASEDFTLGDAIATDRYVITANASSLCLDTLDGRQRLGFRVMTITSAQPRGNGWAVSDGASALGLDDQLRGRRRFPSREASPSYNHSLIVLDGRHGVIWSTDGLYLIDLEHPDDGKLLSSMAGTVSYEPTTQLLAIFGDTGLWLGHYNLKTHDLDGQLDLDGEPRSIVLLDPEQNHGNVALMLVQHGQTVAITEIRKVELGAAKPLREGRTSQRTMTGDPWGFRGDLVTELGIAATARHHVSPDGALVAVADHDRITLREREGAVRWSIARSGVVDVAWSALGELVAFGSGMARVDVATGALLERQCGWDFGLWPDDMGVPAGAKLCE